MNTHEERMSHFDVKNDSGEEVPPFAVMQVAGASKQNGEVVIEIEKPDGTGTSYLLNGPFSIGIGSNGVGSVDFGKRAALDPAETAPSEGDEWGAKSGQWTLSPEGSGFTVIGDVVDDTARVRLTGGGNTGGGEAKLGVVTETGGIDAAYYDDPDIVPGSGSVDVYDEFGVYQTSETWYNWMWGIVGEDKPVIGVVVGTRTYISSEGCTETDLT